MTAKKRFHEAKHDLEQLEAELPNFERLLADNQEEERKLRQIKAPLAELAAALGRVNVAAELLEQHHADIATQRREVARLEAAYQEERKRERVAVLRKETAALHAGFVDLMAGANNALAPFIPKLVNNVDERHQANAELERLGEKPPIFPAATPGPYDHFLGAVLGDVFTRRFEDAQREQNRARAERLAANHGGYK
jgi:DNA repair exonuclease SbcCD ATPase subunit